MLDQLLAHRLMITQRGFSVGATGRRVPTSESIPDEHGAVLRDLVAATGARTILEIGLGNAISTMYLCEEIVRRGGWRPGDVVSMDPHQDDVDRVGLVNLKEAGLGHLVSVYPSRSQLVLPRLVDEGRCFDLAFVDGDHLFDGAFVDFYFVDQLVIPGGLVVVDDAYLPSIQWSLDFFVRNHGWALRDTPFPRGVLGFSSGGCRMAVATLSVSRYEREWDHFEPFGVVGGSNA